MRKRTFVIRAPDGEEDPYWRISVALDLSKMKDGEIVSIFDLDTEKPQEFTYLVRNEELFELHKFYRHGIYSETYETADRANFYHSSTSRVKIQFFQNSTSLEMGGIAGNYERYLPHMHCDKSSLRTLNDNVKCDYDIAPYATSCTGEFICPDHFLPLRSAECNSGSWIACYPNATGLQIIAECVQAYENKGSWEGCPVEPSYIMQLNMIDDGMPKIDDNASEEAGRSFRLRSMQQLCTRPCTGKMCPVPNFNSGRMKIMEYLICCRCVAIYKCNFRGGRRSAIFV